MPAHKLHYKTEFQALPISIENRKNSNRHWYDSAADEEGVTKMKHPYGYVRGTLGIDGDAVDVFIGPNKVSTRVFVITQLKKPEFKEVDEQKVMLGFDSAEDAKKAYLKHYDDARFFGSMKEFSMEKFKELLISKKGKLIKSSDFRYLLCNLGLSAKINEVLFVDLPIKKGKIMAEEKKIVKPDEDDEATEKAKKKTHPVSEAQRKWAWAAEDRGELPGGTAEKWSRRAEHKDLPKTTTHKSKTMEACDLLKSASASLSKYKMDLNKKEDETDEDEKEVTKSSHNQRLSVAKALKAAAVSSLTRRQRMDLLYNLGKIEGAKNRESAEPVSLSPINVATPYSPHEAPIAARHVANPELITQEAVVYKSCGSCGYVHKSTSPCSVCESRRAVSEVKKEYWRE